MNRLSDAAQKDVLLAAVVAWKSFTDLGNSSSIMSSGATIGASSSILMPLKIVHNPVSPHQPVRSSEDGIFMKTSSMNPDEFYEVDYGGDRFAVRLTNKGVLETYIKED